MKIKFGLYDADGDAIQSATTLKCKVKRDADDFIYDWDDSTFKGTGWTTIAEQMVEVDSTNLPGEYEKAVDESGWDDGIYTVYCNYSTSPKQNGSSEVRVQDGAEATLLSTTEVGTSVWDATVDETTAGSAPTTAKGKLQAIWNRLFTKKAVTSSAEVSYEKNNSTTMKSWVLEDDDTTATRTP